MGSLQEFTRLKVAAGEDGDLAWLMMLEALIFQADAEGRWLDLCEARLAGVDFRSAEPRQAGRDDGAEAFVQVEHKH
jgi:hypothetical protein